MTLEKDLNMSKHIFFKRWAMNSLKHYILKKRKLSFFTNTAIVSLAEESDTKIILTQQEKSKLPLLI